MTVDEFLERHDSRQLAELGALEEVAGPPLPERLDRLALYLAGVFINCQPRKKGAKPMKLDDLVPWLQRHETPADARERVFRTLFAATQGGR